MIVRLLSFWFLVLLPPVVYGQDALPHHFHVEPVVSITGVTSSKAGLAWNDLYGARAGLSLTSMLLVYGGYWPLQPVAPIRFHEQPLPADRLGQWSAGLRLMTPLWAAHGVFGSLSVGRGALRSDREMYSGWNLGWHVDFWLRPSFFLRGGLDVAIVDDHFGFGIQFGAAVVPFRW